VTVLVTGATGTLGRPLVEAARRRAGGAGDVSTRGGGGQKTARAIDVVACGSLSGLVAALITIPAPRTASASPSPVLRSAFTSPGYVPS
jgi:nucleoside-diphosphate-sugar epimerase